MLHEAPNPAAVLDPSFVGEQLVAPGLPGDDGESSKYTAVHTIKADELARERGMLQERPDESGADTAEVARIFANRERVSRNTTDFEGKVDIRSWVAGDEAIVIERKSLPAGYNKLNNAFYQRASQATNNREIIKSIYDAVGDTMDYDLPFTTVQSDALTSNHRKINLGVYLDEGKGVCRHMSLAAAWLGSELSKQGIVKGVFTSEVNQRELKNGEGSTERDAHQWTRYTGIDGQVLILDPAQKFFGTLEEAYDRKGWDYLRDNEREAFQAKRLADKIVEHEAGPKPRGQELQNAYFEKSARYDAVKPQLVEFATVMSDKNRLQMLTPGNLTALRGATERFYDIAKDLLVGSYTTADQKRAEALADQIAEVMNVERLYGKGMIVMPEETAAWLSCVLDTSKFMEGKLNPTKDFSKTAQVAQLVNTGLEDWFNKGI
ncbi:MAG: hypothetical protein JWO41_877 [Candidatus Saccharibacteria bacterium]|nr:hypothetical protein [Candidatus Saccharibacteria bacterium]